jgi:branched-chain amino acid transport system ATP-binding protein
MQRRIEIARALCVDPLLLCLDEPAAGLNPRESAELNELLKHLSRDEGIAILLITSEMPELLAMSDRIMVMHRGEVTAHLRREEFSQERILHAAMGERNV